MTMIKKKTMDLVEYTGISLTPFICPSLLIDLPCASSYFPLLSTIAMKGLLGCASYRNRQSPPKKTLD